MFIVRWCKKLRLSLTGKETQACLLFYASFTNWRWHYYLVLYFSSYLEFIIAEEYKKQPAW